MAGQRRPQRLHDLDLTLTFSRDEEQARLETAQRRLLELRLQLGGKLGDGRLGPPVCVLLEGWDASGKGGAIKRLVAPLDPRHVRVVAFAAPTWDEKRHHFLWRFDRVLPGWGGMSVLDRSWYGRVLVERVEGFATEEQWSRAYDEIVQFERILAREGAIIIKFWLHISDAEQLKRFKRREKDPLRRWKMSDEDWRNRKRRPQYEQAVEDMLVRTDHRARALAAHRGRIEALCASEGGRDHDRGDRARHARARHDPPARRIEPGSMSAGGSVSSPTGVSTELVSSLTGRLLLRIYRRLGAVYPTVMVELAAPVRVRDRRRLDPVRKPVPGRRLGFDASLLRIRRGTADGRLRGGCLPGPPRAHAGAPMDSRAERAGVHAPRLGGGDLTAGLLPAHAFLPASHGGGSRRGDRLHHLRPDACRGRCAVRGRLRGGRLRGRSRLLLARGDDAPGGRGHRDRPARSHRRRGKGRLAEDEAAGGAADHQRDHRCDRGWLDLARQRSHGAGPGLADCDRCGADRLVAAGAARGVGDPAPDR